MWWALTALGTSSKPGLRVNRKQASGWVSSLMQILSFRSSHSVALGADTWNRMRSRPLSLTDNSDLILRFRRGRAENLNSASR
jgi:hypothetical protein